MTALTTTLFAADHSNPLIPETNEVIWATVSFVLLFIIVGKLVFPTISTTLKNRSDNIEGKLDQAEREREAAMQLLKDYQQQLDGAHEEAQRILDQARQNADRLEHELRQKAEEQAARIVERAQETIHAERDRALQTLRGEVGGLAVDLATRVIGESLDRERQLQLVDQYVAELG